MPKGLLLFTDFHAYQWSEFSHLVPSKWGSISDRFDNQIEVLDTILDTASKKNLVVVFAGDLFHQRNSVDTQVFNAVFDTFAKYCDSIPQIFLLRGNHDSINNTMESPTSLSPFNYLNNTKVIAEPARRYVEIDGLGQLTIDFMPYGEDIQQIKKVLAEQSKTVKGPAVRVFHLGIDGAKQGRHSHRLASAFTLDDLYPDYYDLVYGGHYHKRQYLGGRNSVLYGGSTVPLNFDDEGENKGYDIYIPKQSFDFTESNSKKFITLNHWDDSLQDKYKNYYVRLQLPEKEAKDIETNKTDTVRVEAQPDVDKTTRLGIKADNTPVEITKKYTDEYYPAVSKEASDVIRGVLEGDNS